MSKPERAHDADETGPAASGSVRRFASPPGRDSDDITANQLMQRAREQAEALAAVTEVMQREEVKATVLAEKLAPKQRRLPLKPMLLASLIAFNLYAWFGNPTWLRFREPEVPKASYYANSWEVAVHLQRERIEEYRRARGLLPLRAEQAGPPVPGVIYKPTTAVTYLLLSGEGPERFVYRSSDTLAVALGRAFLQAGLLTGGAR
jgi:hypothetical protein